MDPATLAMTTVSFLSPYLIKASEKTAESALEKLPEAAGKVFRSILNKLREKDTPESGLQELLSRPDDQLSRAGFASQLRNMLEADSTFASQLERMLESAEVQGGDTISNSGSGAVANKGGVAAGEGGNAVRGDVHGGIHLGRHPR